VCKLSICFGAAFWSLKRYTRGQSELATKNSNVCVFNDLSAPSAWHAERKRRRKRALRLCAFRRGADFGSRGRATSSAVSVTGGLPRFVRAVRVHSLKSQKSLRGAIRSLSGNLPQVPSTPRQPWDRLNTEKLFTTGPARPSLDWGRQHPVSFCAGTKLQGQVLFDLFLDNSVS
jgi:hypothetical protein